MRAGWLISLLFLGNALAFSQQARSYFYQGRDYGSEAVFNPLALLVNSGYHIMQVDNRTNRLFEIHYNAGAQNVLMNLSHPWREINKYGWGEFLSSEIFPTSLSIEKAQWVPNYFGHVIGGGIIYRTTQEWYRLHQFKYPALCALGTVAASAFLNEVLENGDYRGTNVDPIADLLIFDYDKNNSLLASFILSPAKEYRAKLNIYPGLISFGKHSPGFYCAIRRDEALLAGIHFSMLPIGLGVHALQ